MRLYIWEGNGISSGYHDDGTLVVLAETRHEARELVWEDRRRRQRRKRYAEARHTRLVKALEKKSGMTLVAIRSHGYWREAYKAELRVIDDAWFDKPEPPKRGWDGSKKALDREPDRIVELDTPALVAFNGGGYD